MCVLDKGSVTIHCYRPKPIFKGPVPWQLCVREQLSNTSLPSRWIVDPTAGVKEKVFSVLRFFFAEGLFPEDVPRIFSAEQRDFYTRSAVNIRGTIRRVQLMIYNLDVIIQHFNSKNIFISAFWAAEFLHFSLPRSILPLGKLHL